MNLCLLENSITQAYKINWIRNGGIIDNQEVPRKRWVRMSHNDSWWFIISQRIDEENLDEDFTQRFSIRKNLDDKNYQNRNFKVDWFS